MREIHAQKTGSDYSRLPKHKSKNKIIQLSSQQVLKRLWGVDRMREATQDRAEILGEYIIETGATVRAAAKVFKISKSTVHTAVTI